MRENHTIARAIYGLLFLTMLMAGNWSLRAQYCLPTYNNQCTSGDYIDEFRFNTINQVGTACGTPGASNYTNYSATVNTTVIAGNTYTVTCKPGPTWGQYFVMFIDLNKDFDYDDPGEFFDVGYAAGGDSVSTPVTIPCGVMGDTTRLRVMCRYSTPVLTQADVCATALSFGEVEEYTLIIQRPTVNAVLNQLASPVTGCGLTANESVSLCVINCGQDTLQSGQLCYTFNGGSPVCETFNTPVPPLDTLCYTFSGTLDLSTFAAYNFSAWVVATGDTFPNDDSIPAVVVNNIPVVTTFPYTEDFDANDGGWTTAGNPSSWAWGVPNNTFITAAASSPNAWVTGLTTLYSPDETSFLISPCFDFSGLTADPFIMFSHIYNTDGFDDEGWLELTTNAGASWSRVGTAATGNNWYNDVNTDAWDGNSSNTAGQWRTADHELTGSAGSANVRVRFVLSADAFTQMEGFGVDDMNIRDTLWNTGVVAVNSPANGCLLGSTETMSVDITNFGSVPISNFQVCAVVNNNPPVCETITQTINPGDTVTYVFTATADLSAPGQHTFNAYTNLPQELVPDNDSTRVGLVNFPVYNTFPFLETFDAGPTDWVSDGVFNEWELGTPNKSVIQGASTPPNAWVTATLGMQAYQNGSDNWVESPCFDFTSIQDPWVATRVWWNSEFSWDGVVLEYSTDQGASWNEIGVMGDPVNWYTDSTINGLVSAGNSGHGWTGRNSSNNGSGGWLQTSHDITSLGGAPSVRFRFHFGSDASVTDDGFAFDNFAIGELPVVDLGSDTIVCDSMVLDPGFTTGQYMWSTSDTSPTLTVDSTMTVALLYTNDIGLIGRDTVVVTLNPTPQVDLGGNQNVCIGDSLCLVLDSTVYPSATWTGSVTGAQYCISTAGTFSVEAVDTVGCISNDTIMTSLVPNPTPNLGPDTTVCAGDTICLDPGCPPTHTFIWSNGATTPTICPNILAGYWVICIDSNNCEGADSIILAPGPVAPVALGAFDTTNCPIVQFTDNSTGTVGGWMWDFGDGNTSTSQNPTNNYQPAGNGTYTVTLIVDNQCAADTTTFTVDIGCLVAIGEGLDNQLYVYPNPNQGRFRIETVLSGNAPVRLEIVNLQGQTVYERDYRYAAGTFTEEVDLSQAAKGVYFVRFDVGGQVKMEKIVLE